MSALVDLPLLVPGLAAAAARSWPHGWSRAWLPGLLAAPRCASPRPHGRAGPEWPPRHLPGSGPAALGDYSQPALRRGEPVPALAGMATALLLTACRGGGPRW